MQPGPVLVTAIRTHSGPPLIPSLNRNGQNGEMNGAKSWAGTARRNDAHFRGWSTDNISSRPSKSLPVATRALRRAWDRNIIVSTKATSGSILGGLGGKGLQTIGNDWATKLSNGRRSIKGL